MNLIWAPDSELPAINSSSHLHFVRSRTSLERNSDISDLLLLSGCVLKRCLLAVGCLELIILKYELTGNLPSILNRWNVAAFLSVDFTCKDAIGGQPVEATGAPENL